MPQPDSRYRESRQRSGRPEVTGQRPARGARSDEDGNQHHRPHRRNSQSHPGHPRRSRQKRPGADRVRVGKRTSPGADGAPGLKECLVSREAVFAIKRETGGLLYGTVRE